jgi:hypothetical protein
LVRLLLQLLLVLLLVLLLPMMMLLVLLQVTAPPSPLPRCRPAHSCYTHAHGTMDSDASTAQRSVTCAAQH